MLSIVKSNLYQIFYFFILLLLFFLSLLYFDSIHSRAISISEMNFYKEINLSQYRNLSSELYRSYDRWV